MGRALVELLTANFRPEISNWDAAVLAKLSDLDALKVEHDENEQRKEPTVSEKVALAGAIAERLQGRQLVNLKQNREGNISHSDESGRTKDIAAAKAGLGSGKTLEAAQKVVEHGAPELVPETASLLRPSRCWSRCNTRAARVQQPAENSAGRAGRLPPHLWPSSCWRRPSSRTKALSWIQGRQRSRQGSSGTDFGNRLTSAVTHTATNEKAQSQNRAKSLI